MAGESAANSNVHSATTAVDLAQGEETGSVGGIPPANPIDAVVDLTQALRDLERGEQTASVLESNLSSLESKLDALLASFGDGENAQQSSGDNSTDAVHQATD
ncbi:MAG: hypothetical protein M1829_003063 [Trizodia sp. TS-e1964]|nr:MAG: hypothetical protein M1829_003063 [Trizodia sp. TS-e1964]